MKYRDKDKSEWLAALCDQYRQIATTWDHHGEHLRDLKAHIGISSESK